MFEICVLYDNGKYFVFDTAYPGYILSKERIPDLARVESNLGKSISGLVGCRFIKEGIWHFDFQTGYVSRVDSITVKEYIPFKVNCNNTLPMANVLLDEMPFDMVIDTGSSVSYLNPSEIWGKLDLIYSDITGFGNNHFETKGRMFRTDLFGHKHEIAVYTTPSATLPNIIGSNFLMKFEWILDLSKETFWINMNQ